MQAEDQKRETEKQNAIDIKENNTPEVWTQANYPLKLNSPEMISPQNDETPKLNNQNVDDETPKLNTHNVTEKVEKEFEQPSVSVPKSAASFNLINKGLYGYRKQKTELP